LDRHAAVGRHDATIQARLASRPSAEWSVAVAENHVAPVALRLLGDDLCGSAGQRQYMIATVFRPLAGQNDLVAVYFRPAQAGDLAGALAGQCEQSDDRGVLVIVAEPGPNQAQF